MRQLTARQEIIQTLLTWWKDVEESWNDGAGSGDYGLPMRNRCANHPSYIELARLWERMRVEVPALHWALRERFLFCTVKPQVVSRRGGRWLVRDNQAVLGAETGEGKGTAPRLEGVTRVVVTWNRAVRAADVHAGIVWLDECWRKDQSPFVPSDLLVQEAA